MVLDGFASSDGTATSDDAPTDAMGEDEFRRSFESLYGRPPPNNLWGATSSGSATQSPLTSSAFGGMGHAGALECKVSAGCGYTFGRGDDATHTDDMERAYDLFYGTSPLSSPPSSPPPTRPSSPAPPAPKTTSNPQAPNRNVNAQGAHLNSDQRRSRKRNREHRRLLRQNQRAENPQASQTPLSTITANHVEHAVVEPAEYDAADIPSGSTGFKARPDIKGRVYTLDELVNGEGFTLIKADSAASRPIVDKNGLIVAVAVGQPQDETWTSTCQRAHEMLLSAGVQCDPSPQSKDHRRGKFTALNAGISFGGGQKVPGNLVHPPRVAQQVETLLSAGEFIRLAGFASRAFQVWAPKLFQYYDEHFNQLLDHHINLRRNFRNSVWAAAAFNCGPRTVTAKHRDFANLPFGWCSVTALGDYDYSAGGHLVLWEAKLVLEFPPGHTVLLPSAAVAHSNTPIGSTESRTSFTQYSAGGVFRWSEHGFQTETRYRAGMSVDELAQVAADNLARTKLGLSLFSRLSDLRTP